MSDPSIETLTAIALQRSPRRPRGANAPSTLAYVRDLDEGDLAEIQNPPAQAIGRGYNVAEGSGLQKIRATHHLAARYLALGKLDAEVAALSGYNIQTIRQLKMDPAFQELVSHYNGRELVKVDELRERAASLGMAFLDELQDRFEDTPESFNNKSLMENASKLLDRTIMPSKATGQGPSGPPAILPAIVFIDATPQGAELPPMRRPDMLDITPQAPANRKDQE